MDRISTSQRSAIMAKIGGKNTAPEIAVRRALHAAGFRFRLHHKELPGRPDVVLPKFHTAIFVNGCFWHGHSCPRGKLPTTNTEFWKAKIGANKDRDTKNHRHLRQLGWSVYVVWTCKLENGVGAILKKLRKRQKTGSFAPL